MRNTEKELHMVREQQELEILRRVLFWLGAAVLLETLVLLGNRFYFHYLTTEIYLAEKLMHVLEVLQYVGLVVALAFLVWAFLGRKKDERAGICRIISAACFAAVSVCAFLFLQVGSSCVSVLLVGIPAMACLIMIYYLYQREFFVSATLSGLAILGLWIFRSASVRYTTFYYIYMVVVICLAALVLALSLRLKKEEGVFQWGEHKIALLKPNTSYKPVWATCALVVAVLALTPLLGAAFAYYAFLALIVWIFVMAVFFTSRLM